MPDRDGRARRASARWCSPAARGARLGGVDKASLELDGVTLLERALAATAVRGRGGRGRRPGARPRGR